MSIGLGSTIANEIAANSTLEKVLGYGDTAGTAQNINLIGPIGGICSARVFNCVDGYVTTNGTNLNADVPLNINLQAGAFTPTHNTLSVTPSGAKIEKLLHVTKANVVGYDPVTGDLTYQPGGGGGGGLPLDQVLLLGNSSGGTDIDMSGTSKINFLTDVDLQKNGVDVLKTSTYVPPPPIPPQPPLDVLLSDRPFIQRTTDPATVLAFNMENPQAIANFNLQPSGDSLFIATKALQLQSTDAASVSAGVTLDYLNHKVEFGIGEAAGSSGGRFLTTANPSASLYVQDNPNSQNSELFIDGAQERLSLNNSVATLVSSSVNDVNVQVGGQNKASRVTLNNKANNKTCALSMDVLGADIAELFAEDQLNIKSNNGDVHLQINPSRHLFVEGIPNVSTSNALYYNSTTKEVTYGAAGGGGGAAPLDQVLALGNATNGHNIDFNTGDKINFNSAIEIDLASVPTILTQPGPAPFNTSVKLNNQSLHITQQPFQAVGIMIEQAGSKYIFGMNGTTDLINSADNHTFKCEANNGVGTLNYTLDPINSECKFSGSLMNTFNIDNNNTVKIRTLPNAITSNAVYYDTTSKELSYAPAGGAPAKLLYTGNIVFAPAQIVNYTAWTSGWSCWLTFDSQPVVFAAGASSPLSLNFLPVELLPAGNLSIPVMCDDGAGVTLECGFVELQSGGKVRFWGPAGGFLTNWSVYPGSTVSYALANQP